MSKVLVVGDAILDIFSEYRQTKFCPDAPEVPVLTRQHVSRRPGGAANVALNLRALLRKSDSVVLVCAVDETLYSFLNEYSVLSHGLGPILSDGASKERVLIDGKFTYRLDRGVIAGIADRLLADYLAKECESADLIVYSDYGLGSVGHLCLTVLLQHRHKLIIDTKETDLGLFEGCKIIKLNRDEWKRVQMRDAIPESHCENLVVTDGGLGSELIMRRNAGSYSVTHSLRVRAFPSEVVDVCGAGDTYVAGLAASLLKSDDMQTAMLFASAAASTVVAQRGTAIADLRKTLEMLGRVE